ncbi:FecR family protein [Chitinophaga sp. 22321]|uniref:FecR domain-containing protein n=1 Tax=Chitinophaga hostae TaxID=2831022 RepID=A0ABS5J1Z4_9BACT|nr:FecR family protein [Chitinophaga hostae]MBS0029219.1 FecR domain-containing protein [Chitinophaga hostae]
MEITPALIGRFFANECTAAEAAAVAGYLEQHPEVLNQWISEQEWEEFESTAHLSPAFSEVMLEEVKKETTTPVKRVSRKWGWTVAAAAAAAAGILTLNFWSSHKQQTGTATVQGPIAAAAITNRDTVVVNREQTKIRIPLEDGSIVELGSNSQLKWQPGQRQVYLEGMARFTVAGSTAHPFTVYTRQVTTTVLGTVFEINARASTHIKLVSGKVMLRPATDTAKANTVYLKPGQTADFGGNGLAFEVHGDKATALTETPALIMGAVEETNEAFVYTKVPLPQLLAGLEKQYNIHISYSPARLKKYYFSGQLLKTETPANILNTIGLLNKLSVMEDSTGFHINK